MSNVQKCFKNCQNITLGRKKFLNCSQKILLQSIFLTKKSFLKPHFAVFSKPHFAFSDVEMDNAVSRKTNLSDLSSFQHRQSRTLINI